MTKKLVCLLISLIVLVCFTLSTTSAGLWTTIRGATLPEVKPTKVYQLDVVGQNVRVYEFDTQDSPVYHCIVIFSESEKKSPVMQCWPKARK